MSDYIYDCKRACKKSPFTVYKNKKKVFGLLNYVIEIKKGV